MRIFIKQAAGMGRVAALQVQGSDSIDSVQSMLEAKYGILHEHQVLCCEGVKLKSSRNLASYGVKEDSQLVLTMRLRGGSARKNAEDKNQLVNTDVRALLYLV